jgi:hypothetical protein
MFFSGYSAQQNRMVALLSTTIEAIDHEILFFYIISGEMGQEFNVA